MSWWKSLKGRVILQEPLARHTTFRIGGPARFFIGPRDLVDLKYIVAQAKESKSRIYVIGKGSNILVSDKGIKAIVLKMDSPFFQKAAKSGSSLEAGAGLELSRLLKCAQNLSLSGLEFLTGIPGTLGGALVMNAGAWGKNIAKVVENVRVMDYNGKIRILDKDDLKFRYRHSNLERFIVLSACIKLTKENKAEIKSRMHRYLKLRRNSQDTALPNAGCILKNSPRESAGKLIDLCGLKGTRIGDALISKKHANFILNCGNASSDDVLKLMELIKKRVKNKFKINLEPEIKIWK